MNAVEKIRNYVEHFADENDLNREDMIRDAEDCFANIATKQTIISIVDEVLSKLNIAK